MKFPHMWPKLQTTFNKFVSRRVEANQPVTRAILTHHIHQAHYPVQDSKGSGRLGSDRRHLGIVGRFLGMRMNTPTISVC